MALRIASVESVVPSAFAPKSVMGKSLFGNVGALMRAMMLGTVSQLTGALGAGALVVAIGAVEQPTNIAATRPRPTAREDVDVSAKKRRGIFMRGGAIKVPCPAKAIS